MILVDSHYHLDFLASTSLQQAFLTHLEAQKAIVIGQTLTPAGFRDALKHSHADSIAPVPRWSLGLHPWEITSSEVATELLDVFADQVTRTRFIGEIGLDFSPRRLPLNDPVLQRQVFDTMLQLIADAARQTSSKAPYVLSIHAVRSAGDVVEAVSRVDGCGATVVPVFHWFSGTSQDLTELIRLGGMISVNPRMLDSKRGRAYVRQVPADRLLLESDLPSELIAAKPDIEAQGRRYADELVETLRATLARMSQIRGCDMIEHIAATQTRLFEIS